MGKAADAEIAALQATIALQDQALLEKNAEIEGLYQQLADWQEYASGKDATIQAQQAKINDLTAQLAAKNSEISALKAEIVGLQAALAACEGTDPEPEPPSGTLMGVTVNGGVRKNMPDLHDDVQISRVFAAGATNWPNESQHKAFPNSIWAVSNSYALSEANLPKMLASIPDADKKKIIAWADGHELEHPDKNLNPAEVKARVKRTAPVIRSFGLRPAWCMMGYSLRNDDWLDWVDPDDVDVLYFDKYNSANKKNPPGYTAPEDMVRNAVAASKRFGKPWGFWETGTNNFGDQAKRVAWAKALRAEMARQGAECAIWFDRTSTDGSDWDATLDRPTAEAWLL